MRWSPLQSDIHEAKAIMNIPKEYAKDFEAFPPVLRKLLDAELAAGNEIAEIGHGLPRS